MNIPIGTLRSEKSFDRLVEANRTGRVGYFQVSYRRYDGEVHIVCFMACGFEDASIIFSGFALGDLIAVKEISYEAFTDWYKVLVKAMAERGSF